MVDKSKFVAKAFFPHMYWSSHEYLTSSTHDAHNIGHMGARVGDTIKRSYRVLYFLIR